MGWTLAVYLFSLLKMESAHSLGTSHLFTTSMNCILQQGWVVQFRPWLLDGFWTVGSYCYDAEPVQISVVHFIAYFSTVVTSLPLRWNHTVSTSCIYEYPVDLPVKFHETSGHSGYLNKIHRNKSVNESDTNVVLPISRRTM